MKIEEVSSAGDLSLFRWRNHFYRQIEQTINDEYCANLLMELGKAIKKETLQEYWWKVLFHQDNVPAHNSFISVCSLRESGFN